VGSCLFGLLYWINRSGSDTNKAAPLPPTPEVPILTTTVPKPPTPPVKPSIPVHSDDQVIQGVLDRLSIVDYSDILKSMQPSGAWTPSMLYKSEDLISTVKKAMEVGAGSMKLFDLVMSRVQV